MRREGERDRGRREEREREKRNKYVCVREREWLLEQLTRQGLLVH